MANALDKSFESMFGFVSVLPGAFCAFRMGPWIQESSGGGNLVNIDTGPLSRRPMAQYLLPLTRTSNDGYDSLGPMNKNMYLAEDSAKESVSLAQSSYWPRVSGSVSYDQSADNFSFNQANDNKSATVSVSWNLWESGGSYHGVRKARYNLQKSIYLTQDKENQIEKEVEAAWVGVFTNKKEVEIFGKILKTAQENYRAYLIQFQEQEATAKNVLDAQDLLTSTVGSYIASLSSYYTAIAKLNLTMGKI